MTKSTPNRNHFGKNNDQRNAVVESVEQSLERIATLNEILHAVISIDQTARATSQNLEPLKAPNNKVSPLYGMPLLIKDNIHSEGLPTTAGSLALGQHRPASGDAPAVAALRAAGAIVLGKTNLSEWANFRSTSSVSGWSAVGGLTANPYILDRSAGGSSSGSAAAVAAGIVQGALGTETDGSILCPASLCGCVGLKPTVGLIRCDGVIPIAHSQDTVGPIASSVLVVAAMLGAMTGGNYTSALKRGVVGLRVGIPRSKTWERPTSIAVPYERAIAALARAGAKLVDNVVLTTPGSLDADEMTVLIHEFHSDIEVYLSQHGPINIQTLHDLIDFNAGNTAELAYFNQEIFELAAGTGNLDSTTYCEALRRCVRAGREEGIDAALQNANLDALIVPSYDPAWKSDLVNGDPSELYSPSQLPAVAGYPALTVPVGLVGGLPVGVTLIGSARSEAKLLRLAATIEGTCDPLPEPTFRPTDLC